MVRGLTYTQRMHALPPDRNDDDDSHAQSESAGPNKSWRQAVATLGRPHCPDSFGNGTARTFLTVGPPQCSYSLPPRFVWTCGFTLSVVTNGDKRAASPGVAVAVAWRGVAHHSFQSSRSSKSSSATQLQSLCLPHISSSTREAIGGCDLRQQPQRRNSVRRRRKDSRDSTVSVTMTWGATTHSPALARRVWPGFSIQMFVRCSPLRRSPGCGQRRLCCGVAQLGTKPACAARWTLRDQGEAGTGFAQTRAEASAGAGAGAGAGATESHRLGEACALKKGGREYKRGGSGARAAALLFTSWISALYLPNDADARDGVTTLMSWP